MDCVSQRKPGSPGRGPGFFSASALMAASRGWAAACGFNPQFGSGVPIVEPSYVT